MYRKRREMSLTYFYFIKSNMLFDVNVPEAVFVELGNVNIETHV